MSSGLDFPRRFLRAPPALSKLLSLIQRCTQSRGSAVMHRTRRQQGLNKLMIVSLSPPSLLRRLRRPIARENQFPLRPAIAKLARYPTWPARLLSCKPRLLCLTVPAGLLKMHCQ